MARSVADVPIATDSAMISPCPFRKRGKADEEQVARLRGVAFFEGLSEKELARVGELADDVEAEAGTRLTEQGRGFPPSARGAQPQAPRAEPARLRSLAVAGRPR
jgi:hypothetical protein